MEVRMNVYYFADLQMMTAKAGGPELAAQFEHFPELPAFPTARMD